MTGGDRYTGCQLHDRSANLGVVPCRPLPGLYVQQPHGLRRSQRPSVRPVLSTGKRARLLRERELHDPQKEAFAVTGPAAGVNRVATCAAAVSRPCVTRLSGISVCNVRQLAAARIEIQRSAHKKALRGGARVTQGPKHCPRSWKGGLKPGAEFAARRAKPVPRDCFSDPLADTRDIVQDVRDSRAPLSPRWSRRHGPDRTGGLHGSANAAHFVLDRHFGGARHD